MNLLKNLNKEPGNPCKHIPFTFKFVLSIFLIVATVFVFVSIQNKIKEGRYIGQEVERKNTIVVSGTGEIYTKPDLALISFSVVTEGKTVEIAMSDGTKKMNSVISAIKKLGVDDKDLKTTSFNIYPRYEYRSLDDKWEPEGRRVLVGYEVNQTVQVKIRDLDKVGSIIQKATDVGANQVGSLQFTIDDQDAIKAEARKEAIDDAKAKAETIARQLGVDLIKITSFSENSYAPRWDTVSYAQESAGGYDVAPQIEAGENKVQVTVSITYEID